jgi:hypothetical protein
MVAPYERRMVAVDDYLALQHDDVLAVLGR